MDKKQVADILEQIGVLLELKGENPFKTRAYYNGARVIKGLPGDLQALVESGEIGSVKGIGKALAEKITTLVSTGGLPFYDELRASFPASLLDILRIPGLGPKKIRKLYTELGIDSLEALEKACQEDRVAALDGFGSKMQAKILEGIAFIRKHSGRHHYHSAAAAAERLLLALRARPAVIRAEVAGSLRRHRETVKDIDIVASAEEKDRAGLMTFFVTMPGVASVVAHGETKSSVILEEGIQADLRVVSEAAFPFTLHHFTGSKEHNTAMRALARRSGLKMNEYGLFREDDSVIACSTEEEIFQVLGMSYIPPELREDRGEIQAAREQAIPELIRREHIRGILHTHTTWSDGTASLEEMAEACRDMGMHYLGIADHSQVVVYANGLSIDRLHQQAVAIRELNERYDDFRIFHGTECDIMPDGTLDFPEEILAELDYVVISVHSKMQMSEKEATERIIRAMSSPYATILGHPTGRILLGREGYPLNYDAIFQAAAEYNVAIEINANPYRFDLDWRYVRQARDAGVMLSINPDAHSISGLQDTFLGIGIARKGWLGPQHVLNTKSQEEIAAWFAAARQGK